MLASFGYPAIVLHPFPDAIAQPEEFWWDQLEYIFHAPGFNLTMAREIVEKRFVHGGADIECDRQHDEPLSNFLGLWELLRRLPGSDRHKCLNNMREGMGIMGRMRSTHRPMTLSELRVLAANPLFEIGGHTSTHPSLAALTQMEQEREIVGGAQALEAVIGRHIRSFSYPFGDWKSVTRDIVASAGFEFAVTTRPRRVRIGDNEFELPRRQVVNRNVPTH